MRILGSCFLKIFIIGACGFILAGFASLAQAEEEAPPPMSLDMLQNIKQEKKVSDEEKLPFDIREDAIREAALSFGARGGLSRRIYEIRQELEYRSRYLDKVYDFTQLLIPAPSGLLIEPPIITESDNAMIIQSGGQQAAVSDRIYNIITNAQIVSAPRTWRAYLERAWGEVELPNDLLRPENEEEREIWIKLVAEGWEQGVQQANDIFEADLSRLVGDYQGMIRYRTLVAQGMVSAPYALQVDRGITGDANQMRIGDRAVEITGVPQLVTGSDQWQPASR
jgi:defect-in-organelle-trafficking protein DotC